MKKILITGATGQVGHALRQLYAQDKNVVALGRDKFNLDNPDKMRSVLRDFKPAIIINTAAYTAVDKAESEPELAMQLNGVAPGVIAEEAKRLGAMLVHYSTDYVFDGSGDRPWTEEDKPDPINVYGKTKLAGEKAIQEVGARYMIFRTSWVYGPHGNNFLKTMLRLFYEKDELSIVNDQIGVPTSAITLAEYTKTIIERVGPDKDKLDQPALYHMTDKGETSWYGFAYEIKKLSGSNVRLTPITTSEYKTTARRPLNSRLSTVKLESVFDLQLPDWQMSLQRVFRLLG